MNIYVAAPWVRRHEAAAAACHLEARGHHITYKWWEHEKGAGDDGYLAHTDEQMTEYAARDMQGVLRADVVLVLNIEKSEGKAVEQGIALAAGIPVVVVGQRSNIFHYLPEPIVTLVPDLPTAFDALR